MGADSNSTVAVTQRGRWRIYAGWKIMEEYPQSHEPLVASGGVICITAISTILFRSVWMNEMEVGFNGRVWNVIVNELEVGY